jgi:hypothetical protein
MKNKQKTLVILQFIFISFFTFLMVLALIDAILKN